MFSRRFAFLRGKSLSEETTPPMDRIKAKKRAVTLPDPDVPVDELARLAIDTLPETHQELFLKLIQKPLTEFTLFPDLPIEVRLRIIRMLFPKDREIRLRVQYRHGEYTKDDFGFPPPISLWINKESRIETLKHYHFFSQVLAFDDSASSIAIKPHCYCINPHLDKLSVGFQSLWNHNYSLFLKTAFKEIKHSMREIHILEIVDVLQASFVLQSTSEEIVEKFMAHNLARFHYLKELHFILDRREVIESEFVNNWKERVKKAFEKEKMRYPHCSIPRVICVSWKVRDAMRFLKLEHRV